MCDDILTRLKTRLQWAESYGYEVLANDLRDTIRYLENIEMVRRIVRRAAENHTEPGAKKLIENVVKIAKGGRSWD